MAECKKTNFYKFNVYSPSETKYLGDVIGKLLLPNDVVCIYGDLGVGKTVLVQGIASALGIDDYITSPTFTIVNEYDSSPPLYHFDVYRIPSPDEVEGIGFHDYMNSDGVVVIEWADLIHEILPDTCIKISIYKDLDINKDARIITIEIPVGHKNESLFKEELNKEF